MPCSNGSRAKSGVSEYVWFNISDALGGCDSAIVPWWCSFVFGLTNWAEPSAQFCSQPPPGADNYNFLPQDYGLAQTATRISKLTAYVRAWHWNKYCECVPFDPPSTNCMPSHVPAPNYECGKYTLTAIGDSSGQQKSFTIDIFQGTKWTSAGGRFDAFDYCGCNNSYGYFYQLAGEDARLGTMSLTRIGTNCPCTNPDPIPTPVPPPKPDPIPNPPSTNPGVKGDKGDKGDPGVKGDDGDPGVKGDKGDRGEQGLQGSKGDTGATGAKGDPGATGEKGEKGDKGDKGDPGVGSPGATGATGAKGDKGDKGDPGTPGIDAEVEYSSIQVQIGKCENHVYSFTNQSIQVIKGTEDLNVRFIEAQNDLIKSTCAIEKHSEEGDYNVGEPLSSYEKFTGECCVLYFNDAKTTRTRAGRYLQIPKPNQSAILLWASENFEYNTGSYMAYTQYEHSRGVKIQVFGRTPEHADEVRNQLEQLTTFTEEDVFFKAPARMCSSKHEIDLRLVRITYFKDNSRSKDAHSPGKVIWEA